jgi:Carboxypeptidase regulatory-like domain
MFQVPEGMEGDGITISVSSLDRQTGVEGEIPKAGPFHIDGLDDGAYRILATTKAIPGRSRAFVSRTLELTDRNIDDLRLVMRPGVALRAVVTMAEEKADTPAGIRFMPLALDGWMPFYLDEPRTETTPDRLRVAALPPGEYWTDSLMLPSGYAVVSASYNGQPVSNSAIHVEAPESAVTYLLTSLPGRVTGTVRDADGKPVPDASVVLLPAWVLDTFETFDPQMQRTIGLMRMAHVQNSDTNGGFHFSDLAPGLYKAVALTGNARRSTHDLIFLRDRLRLVDALVLERGQTANLDIHVIE